MSFISLSHTVVLNLCHHVIFVGPLPRGKSARIWLIFIPMLFVQKVVCLLHIVHGNRLHLVETFLNLCI